MAAFDTYFSTRAVIKCRFSKAKKRRVRPVQLRHSKEETVLKKSGNDDDCSSSATHLLSQSRTVTCSSPGRLITGRRLSRVVAFVMLIKLNEVFSFWLAQFEKKKKKKKMKKRAPASSASAPSLFLFLTHGNAPAVLRRFRRPW